MRVVMKFGGTSLADDARVLRAAEKVMARWQAGEQVVVVVSAQGHSTDELLQKVNRLNSVPPAREMDTCLSALEQISAGMMALALNRLGCPAVSLTGYQAGIVTDAVHGDARILGLRHRRIQQELDRGNVAVVAGFQGINGNGDITTLGRGGSDTTAVALAALLGAHLCEIYTDVDGVYDRDPRQYPDAVKLERVGYEEMLDMAKKGAQVMHPGSIEWGMLYRVPIRVRSSFREGEGTLIGDPLE